MGKKSKKKKKQRQYLEQLAQKPIVSHYALENICVFIIRWGVYLALFAPLLVVKYSFFPFVTPKTIFFRIMVEIIFAAYLILAISLPKYRPRKNWLTIALAVFLGVLILTSITGINFSRSMWSTYERMTGLFTFFHLFAFFLVLVSVFKKRTDWEKILSAAIFVGVLLSIYVLFSDTMSSRGGGTIGNTSFMAAYLLFDVFLALSLFLVNLPVSWWWNKIRGKFAPISFGQKIIGGYAGASLVILLAALFASTAQGAILAFWGGIFLMVLVWLLLAQQKLLNKIGLTIIFLIIISVIMLALWQPQPLKEKISNNLKDLNPRLVMWDIGLKGFKERPILGWGPENFNIVFTRYFNPCMPLSECGKETWFDRSHNIFFDTANNSGIVGLLSYLSVFVAAIWALLRTARRALKKQNIFLPLGIAVLLVVYLVQDILVFDMINSYLMFFLVLAFAAFLTSDNREQEPAASEKKISAVLKSIIIALTIILVWFGNIKHLKTSYATAKTIAYFAQLEKSMGFFKDSLDSWMNNYEPREQFAQKLYGVPIEVKPIGDTLASAFELGISEMEKSIKENPLDFRHHLFLARSLTNYHHIFNSAASLSRAEQVLENAIKLSPANQQGYWELAEIKFAKAEYSEAVELLKTAVDLEPRLGQSHWYLAIAHQLNGNSEAALESMERARNAHRPYDVASRFDELKRAINIYTIFSDFEKLAPLYEKFLEFDSSEPSIWSNLINVYLRLGQPQKAQEIVQRLTQEQPDLVEQVKSILEQ